jgi:periplasmic copper chaperone A
VLAAWGAAFWPALAAAHGSRLGDIVVDHPYATPTPAGARTGAAYLRGLLNRGRQPDRLIGASTPLADTVEFHRSSRDGDVMRMRAVDAIDVPAGAELRLRHDGDTHLMLVGLKEPLRDGQRFPLRLRFERAGEVEVMVWVQTPHNGGTHRH